MLATLISTRDFQAAGLFVPLAVAPALAQEPLTDPLPDIPDSSTVLFLEDLVSDLSFPVDVAQVPDGSGRLMVNLVDGRTYVLEDGVVSPEPFVDLRQSPPFGSNGSAMAALAFHPDFAMDEQSGEGGRLYVIMTEAPGSGTADFGINPAQQSVLYELRPRSDDPNREDPARRRELLRIDEDNTIHNLNDLAFGPDGYLYLAKGDDRTGGQDTTTIHGTVLRIDVDGRAGNAPSANGAYFLPADNPFVGDIGGLDEIYAYGFRNPWRFGFDSVTGKLLVTDIGEFHIEEINRVDLAADGSARNYGWNLMEGPFAYLNPGVSDDLSGLPDGFEGVRPIGAYDHTQNHRSITGGVLYRGNSMPQLRGQYLFADWISGQLFGLEPQTGRIQRFPIDPGGASINGQPPYATSGPPEGVIAVREDASGELLLVVTQRNSSDTGRIVRVRLADCPIEARCTSTPNSSGAAAHMSWSGSASLATNDLVLGAGPVPDQSIGLFFYGPAAIEVPFGNGFRCVGGQVVRIDPTVVESSGSLALAWDNSLPPHQGLQSGQTLQFQAWFRDPVAGAAGYDLSDALAVTLCP